VANGTTSARSRGLSCLFLAPEFTWSCFGGRPRARRGGPRPPLIASLPCRKSRVGRDLVYVVAAFVPGSGPPVREPASGGRRRIRRARPVRPPGQARSTGNRARGPGVAVDRGARRAGTSPQCKTPAGRVPSEPGRAGTMFVDRQARGVGYPSSRCTALSRTPVEPPEPEARRRELDVPAPGRCQRDPSRFSGGRKLAYRVAPGSSVCRRPRRAAPLARFVLRQPGPQPPVVAGPRRRLTRAERHGQGPGVREQPGSSGPERAAKPPPGRGNA